MKFIVPSSVLLKNLININGVVANNPIVPILENFLFRIEEGILTVTADDIKSSTNSFDARAGAVAGVLILNKVFFADKDKEVDEIILKIYKDNKEISRVHHYDFERIVRRLFIGLGYDVTPTKRTRDGGYDMVAETRGVIPTSHLIECKSTKTGKKVSIDIVERFLFKINQMKASSGVLVTNFKFSMDVLKHYATSSYKHCLKLIDGDELLRMIGNYVKGFALA